MRIFFVLLLYSVVCGCKSKEASTVPVSFEATRLSSLVFDDTLLSKTEVAALAEVPAAKLHIYKQRTGTDSATANILYSWPTGETKTVTTHDKRQLRIDVFGSIGIGFTKPTDLASFTRSYESPDALKEKIKAVTSDSAIDPDIAIAEARFLASQRTTQGFEKVSDVGEAAYWETPVEALHVFAKGYAFTVTTNCKDARAKAKRFATLIFTTLSKR